MIYFADLHIHSRFSRATSKDCNFVELSRWAVRKGIRVLATGDFTHPEWSKEIAETLEEADRGLYRLKPEYAPETETPPGGFGPLDVRYILNVEISSIYKKNGAVRKAHNLVFMPGIESMERFNTRLDRIGNIKSDGRPILGLDARDLLEIALECSDESFVIPAHVWTPWFSVLGSKSGFDSVEECFEDLSHHIFALETGLSSDPEMNHRVTSLDGFTLVSNSDCHSPANLGREANIFVGEPGYKDIREAIRKGGGSLSLDESAECPRRSVTLPDRADSFDGLSTAFVGTIEFFPEEGKYHLDGHRKCSMRMEPEETDEVDGLCPVCGSKVTVGVMNRVAKLGSRPYGEKPDHAAPFWRMLPLAEITAQSLGVGPQSKKVKALYMELLAKLGPELHILWSLPIEEIAEKAPKIIVEGLSRVRKGEVSILAGYDGEYGTVRLFTNDEREQLLGQESFLPVRKSAGRKKRRTGGATTGSRKVMSKKNDAPPEKTEISLNEEQARAAYAEAGPVVAQAGPGTGKTRTLIERIAYLVSSGKAKASEISAVTFTRKAAGEMRERLSTHSSVGRLEDVWVGTFHQLGASILDYFSDEGIAPKPDKTLDEEEALALFRKAVKTAGLDIRAQSAPGLFSRVSLLKQSLVEPESVSDDAELRAAYKAYQDALEAEGALDLDDLLIKPIHLLRNRPEEAASFVQNSVRHLLVDEFQDVNKAQYESTRLLAGPAGRGLFVIGDTNQAIYGFRGSDWRYFHQLGEDYAEALRVSLKTNYRSQRNIITAASGLLESTGVEAVLETVEGPTSPIRIATLPGAGSEGMFVTRAIDAMLGGSSFFALDSGRTDAADEGLGFKDFAVVYRLNTVGDVIEKAFMESGIPYQRSRRKNPKAESEELDPRAEAVTLMTMHAAKGLEFPVVFVTGCDDCVIPGVRDDADEGDDVNLDEERRLLYTAMTRAGKELFITHARRRTLYGRSLSSPITRFLEGAASLPIFEKMSPLKGRRKPEEDLPIQQELFQ